LRPGVIDAAQLGEGRCGDAWPHPIDPAAERVPGVRGVDDNPVAWQDRGAI